MIPFKLDFDRFGKPTRIPDEYKGSRFVPFDRPRRVSEYLGIAGPHNELALPPWVLDSRAATLTRSLPDEFVVVGYDLDAQGVQWLRFEATRAYIEAVTDYRDKGDRLRYVCPSCGQMDGKHARTCAL